MTNKFLIVVVGPTAIGKTILSIEIAKQLNTEIISADSRQFFRELNIGTAKPLPQELSQIKHHFINSHSISQNYNVGMFETEAISFIDNFFKTNNTLLLTGGSGLYIDAVCKGIDDFPPADALLREELTNNLKKNGIADIQNLLKKLDFIHYEKADLSNPHRIIRALEVCLLTGKPYSSFRKNTAKKRNFNILKIGLTVERNQLYEKMKSSIQEVRARGARTLIIANDEEAKEVADDLIIIPKTMELLEPLLNTIPLQLFAYHIAVGLGRDVDRPRNLAKSVTVE